MSLKIWICLGVYVVVMAGVSYYAHHIGAIGGLVTIAAMYGAAKWYDQRERR